MDTPSESERAEKIRALFEDAVRLHPDDRRLFLDNLLGEDKELLQEVADLLDADTRARDVLRDLDSPLEGQEDPRLGTTISHYEIVSRIGQGGMGIVYKALDTRLRRTVALKFLHVHQFGPSEAKRRLIREARAASRLDHPTICRVFDIDEVDGQLFIVMEFVDGPSLSDRVRPPMEIGEAVQIGIQIAEGLSAAHQAGIIHRDIKPGNVMLPGTGGLRIMDFGLAKFATDSTATTGAAVLGTASYMSPEQARGERVDHRTDIFSLGCVLYELVAGRRAFKGEFTEAIIYSILNEDPPLPGGVRQGVPAALDGIIMKCLAKEADDRYPCAQDLVSDLRNVVVGETESNVPRVRLKRRPARPVVPRLRVASNVTAQRKPTKAIFAGMILITLVFVLGYLLGRNSFPTHVDTPLQASLTVQSSHFINPAISHDGRYMAYVGRGVRQDENILFIYDFVTGETHEHRRDRRVLLPLFSPDNQYIGFHEGAWLYAGPIDFTTPPTRVFEVGDQYFWWIWAPDGSILFTRGDLRILERIESDGSGLSVVMRAHLNSGERFLWPINHLEDGRLLLGIEDTTQTMDLYAVDVEGGARYPIPDGKYAYAYYSHSGHLLWWPDGLPRLYARAFDSRSLRFLSETREVLGIRNVSVALSDNGRLINYNDSLSHHYVSRRVAYMDREGNCSELPFPKADYKNIRIGPEGRRIAYTIGENVFFASIFDGSIRRQLTSGGGHRSPVWSRNGEELVSNWWRRGARLFQLEGIDQPTLLVTHAKVRSFSETDSEFGRNVGFRDMSSDGRLLAFVDKPFMRTPRELLVVSAADSTLRIRLSNRNGISDPRFAPNDRFIAYVQHTAPGKRIRVIDVDGRLDDVLVERAALPVWSPDGRYMYFVTDGALYELPIQIGERVTASGEPRRVYQATYQFLYDVMPDGSGFIISEATGPPQRDVQVIDHFFERLDELVPAKE